ncbi:DUF4247 domain-containing protein [Oceanobacillus caeni]|uniref:DUF4247 domain-containing protein n=1 Tax=Oceanobacillus caeni TaxID=405946 RepID=UPI0036329CDA
MYKKWIVRIGLILFLLLITACSSPMPDSSNRGMEENMEITAEDITEEPSKENIINNLKESPSNQIDALIASNFPQVDVVMEDDSMAEIYATKQFQLNELSSLLTEKVKPNEESEVVDDSQMFIYPDYFITLKQSEIDRDVLLIEVASETFVKRNYSPSFLSTYFTIRMLDSLFGNNWSSRRSQDCVNEGCYGGYKGGYYGGSTSSPPKRGNSTYRGGGPGAGK